MARSILAGKEMRHDSQPVVSCPGSKKGGMRRDMTPSPMYHAHVVIGAQWVGDDTKSVVSRPKCDAKARTRGQSFLGCPQP